MEIIIDKPPIWDEAHKHFDIDDTCTVYTWGNKLYNPANVDIPEALMAHEKTHTKQQEAEGGPEKWWKRYFAEPGFRAQEEAEAYAAQYVHYANRHTDRNKRMKYLIELSTALSSGMYGLTMVRSEAREAIMANVEKR